MSRLDASLGVNLAARERFAEPCPEPPPCPACGGLTSFCRPRFFAGQILTESDLNRLEAYVVEKDRLHNRYLHGWGVVCGLQVSINPCGDRVTVGPGYALSPCGDDIIVPEEETAPICQLIRQCRPVRPDPCDGPVLGRRDSDRIAESEDFVEDWVLAICYQERPSRGVMPLRSCSSTSSRCSCGGSSAGGCNCGCGGSQTSASRASCAGPTRAAAAACEPTLTCEGYTFTVYKAPVSNVLRRESNANEATDVLQQPVVGGRISEKIRASLRAMLEVIPRAPTSDSSVAAKQEWFLTMKQGLHELLTALPVHDATLADQLVAIKFPAPDSRTFNSDFEAVLLALALIFAAVLREPICSALMPPCPPPADCNCVPLATIQVRRRDCRVLRVCNWAGRKWVLTFPDLIYWFEGTELFKLLALAIERICCRPLELLQRVTLLSRATTPAATTGPTGGPPTTPTAPQPSPAPPPTQPAPSTTVVGSSASPLAQFVSQSWVNRDTRVIDATTLAAAYLGLGDDKGNPLASPFETANPGPFLAVNQMFRPAIEGIFPTELSQLMSQLAIQRSQRAAPSDSTAPTPSVAPADLDALRQAVAELQATVKAQADEIAKLKKP